MNHILARVVGKTREACDILSIELEEADGKPLPPFSAGSHIDVHVTPGITRQYSLCNAPHERHRYVIGVLRDPASRGGSSTLHDDVSIGDLIPISEPRNHFPLEPANRSILFAGGIGVTPILCMAERLAQIHADFELHYCARSKDRAAFVDRIAASPFASRVHYHFDDGEPAQHIDIVAVLGRPRHDTHVYVCGPSGFIALVRDTATKLGWDAACVHSEYFSALPVDTSKDGSFLVQLASTGEVFTVPAGVPVTHVLADNGVHIPTSCEEGVCGTCVTRVLDGIPDHRDCYFTNRERAANDQFTPCCSRSITGTLVLDL
ncbi:PDR/VanB family oxidoreductase [Burkholderia anthina]|uniref:PDR/VanB family oxidoreductase n=1 Tax=Burkholderia anthina TaxID=179879 RepID=UPI00158EF52D|nr:PDR/VanB family oxidoreductase [Burkholderia anthina]